MSKKLIGAFMALAVFAAFAVMPAMASAAPTITYPTGTLLATGSTIIATNEGDTLMTGSGGEVLVRCKKATLTGTLTTNSSAEGFAGNIEKASFTNETGGKCEGILGATEVTAEIAGGTPYCVKNTKTADQLEIRGGKCTEATRSIKYILHSALNGTCTYESTAPLLGTYKTHPEAATATITKQEFKRIAGLCPEKGFLDMSFALYRDTAEHIKDPLYIDA